MLHNPIERWEWEGGALAVDTKVPEEARPADAPRRPAELSAEAAAVHEQSSSKRSSRDRT